MPQQDLPYLNTWSRLSDFVEDMVKDDVASTQMFMVELSREHGSKRHDVLQVVTVGLPSDRAFVRCSIQADVHA